jgi:hypothetical protein
MKANEFVTEAPRVPAHAAEILSATDDGKTITVRVRAPDGSVRSIANSNPAIVQQWLNLKYGLRLPHSIARKFVGVPAAMAEDQADNPDSWQSQEADARRDAETARMSAQDAKAGGLAEVSLNEFAPGSGGGESARWYTDDQITDIVGDGWWDDLDVSGDISKLEMIQQAQAWLDDQGYSVDVLNCKVNDDDMDWFIEGSFHNPGFAKKGVAEGFPQPGESSGKAKQFNPNAKIQTREMSLDQILSSVKGIPYVNNVIDDWDAKDYSWGVTKKVIEYAQYLQKNPQSVANLPPLVVIDGQLNDGAHRLSAINLLQKRMDPKNPLWKQVKLKVNFGTSSDVAAKQGVAEGDLNEKSTSQAQFRTMAAAAHNPKFAKKVGISQSVAQEFHGADRKQNYKSLPKKVSESKRTTKVMITESRTYKLWENAGHKLMEAQLTADQINQIFQQVEQGATAAGGNRTLIGQGKDAASAVNTAWEELKTKVQNSGPIKGVDAMYDQAAEKLKQATGGDQGVMKYVQKYRDFAKAHPVAQSLIYSALIAAAGISGAGIGGAAALGLFKLVDKLLQGEKFSSAAYQGAKTGGMAYAAGQIGQAMKGAPQGGDISTTTSTGDTAGQVVASTPGNLPTGMKPSFYTQWFINKYAQDPSNPSAMIVQQAKQFAATMAKVNESIELTESQIFLMIGKIVERQRKLDEGIWDSVKGAAGKAVGSAVDWAKTKGANLTTKITADKLLQAWKKAGSPMDSLDVAKVIQSAGVPSASIKQVYGSMKIPFAGEPAAQVPTAKPVVGGVPAVPAPAAQTPAVPPAAKPTAPAGGTMPAQGFNAGNVMKMPGMEKYAKPAAAPAAKTANFGGGPAGYGKTTTTIKPATAKQPAVAAEDASWGMAPESRGYRK